MSNLNGQTNVQAESAATLTPAEAQFIEAYRARDYETVGALLCKLATLGEGDTLHPVEVKRESGYLDTVWEQPIHPDDVEAAEHPADVMTAQVFAALVSGGYIERYWMFSPDENPSELLHAIRRGILAGIRESAVFELVTLKKLYPHVNTEVDTRAARMQALGEFYDELTDDEVTVFWREVKRARPDLYASALQRAVDMERAQAESDNEVQQGYQR